MHPGRDGGPKIEEVQDKTPQKETSAKSTKIFGIFWQFLRGITASDHPDYHIFPKTEKTRFFPQKKHGCNQQPNRSSSACGQLEGTAERKILIP